MIFTRSAKNISIQFWQYLVSGLFVSVAITISEFLDSIIVSNLLGEHGLAIVNLGLPVMLAINVIGMLFGIGPSIAFGNALGQSNRQIANKIYTYTMIISMGITILFSALGLFFCRQISAVLAGNGGVLQPELELFLPYLFLGAPVIILLTLLCQFIQADGRPKTATALVLCSNVINVIMDAVYIQGAGMGAEGSSLGTLTGYAVAMLVLVVLLASKKLSLPSAQISFVDYRLVLQALPKGFSTAMSQSLFLVQVFFINYLANQSDSANGVALISLGLGINSLFCVIITGVTSSMPPLLSVLQGAGDFTGRRLVLKRSFLLITGASSVMLILLWFFPNIIFDLYGLGSRMGVEGEVTIRMFSAAMVAVSITTFTVKHLQLLDKIRMAIVISAMRNALLLIPLIYVFHLSYGLVGISYGYFVGNLLTALFALCQALYISRNSKGALRGPLMLPTRGDNNLFEGSIAFDKMQAVQLSVHVQKTLLEQGETKKTALFLAVAVEELAMLTIERQRNVRPEDKIDVFITKLEKELRLSFRSLGKPFSPSDYLLESGAQENYSNLWMLATLADTFQYERILLMNHTSFYLKN
ncbi:MAG: MATE family efflux transporter [Eubacterium sp.]